MKKYFNILVILLFPIISVNAQENDLEKYIVEGVELHDNADYINAVESYKKALAIDKNSPLANYEIALTYFVLKEYKKAVDHADIVIKQKQDYVNKAYILKGSAEDLDGDQKAAIKTYKKGIKAFPDDYLLSYNMALTYFNSDDFKNTELAIQNALEKNPSHASSHFLLGFAANQKKHRVKSILAFYNFLLLEPTSNRSKNAYQLLIGNLNGGVERKDEKTINIFVNPSDKSNIFSMDEMMLSLLAASDKIDTTKNKTKEELFIDKTTSIFKYLEETKTDKKNFWGEFYINFYSKLIAANHIEAFSYYVSQNANEPANQEWLKNNDEKTDALLKWNAEFKRK